MNPRDLSSAINNSDHCINDKAVQTKQRESTVATEVIIRIL